jgi:hypothetical protein
MIPSTLATYIPVSILCSFSSIVVPLPKHVFHFLSFISSGNFACFASSFTHRETISSRAAANGLEVAVSPLARSTATGHSLVIPTASIGMTNEEAAGRGMKVVKTVSFDLRIQN